MRDGSVADRPGPGRTRAVPPQDRFRPLSAELLHGGRSNLTHLSLCEDLSVIGVAFSVVSHVDGVVLRTVADLESVHQADLDDCADALMATLAQRCTRCRTPRWGSPRSGSPMGYLVRQVR